LFLLVNTPAAIADEPMWADSRQIGPFIVRASFPLADLEPLLGELPELQQELTRTLGVPAAKGPIHVYLFADASEHKRFIAVHYPKIPYRQALFIQTDAELGVYAFRQPELDVDLRHECTHALLHAALGDVPLWLDEGLAEYFEMQPGHRAYDHPNFETLRWNMRLGMVRSIETLESRRELPDMSGLDYSYSWAWVHFMLHGPQDAHRVLVEYLADLHESTNAGKLSTRLNEAVANPSERLVQHFKHWRQ